jgi:hypothetical protein
VNIIGSAMRTTLYANPYDITYTGFYFGSTEEFERNMNKAPFEEVEIDFIEGAILGYFTPLTLTRVTSIFGSMS